MLCSLFAMHKRITKSTYVYSPCRNYTRFKYRINFTTHAELIYQQYHPVRIHTEDILYLKKISKLNFFPFKISCQNISMGQDNPQKLDVQNVYCGGIFIHVSNFHGWPPWQKYLNYKNFPNTGTYSRLFPRWRQWKECAHNSSSSFPEVNIWSWENFHECWLHAQ